MDDIKDYIKIVNEKKSSGIKNKGKELVWYHNDVMRMISGEQEESYPFTDEMGFKKTTLDWQKLEEYSLGTAIVRDRVADEYDSKISEIISSIEKFLTDLKDYFSDSDIDIAEVEIFFSNVIQNHKKLWDLRKYREKSYAEVLVLIESCIRYYDVGELSLCKINVLIEVYAELRNKSMLNSYSKECRKKLQEVGFDIFRPFYVAADKYIVIEKKKS